MASRENLNPQALTRIAKEIQKIAADPNVNGVRFIINEKDLTDIQADIEGPTGTPYEGGVFRCKLIIGSEFPTAPPRGLFLTKIFHPNVSSTGDICVNTLKKDWSPELGLMHVLQVIRCLLIVPFPESALNEEASKLFLESYDEYARRAALMTSIHAMPVKPKADLGVTGAKDGSAASSEAGKGVTASVTSGGSDETQEPNVTKIPKTMPQKKSSSSSSRSALKRL